MTKDERFQIVRDLHELRETKRRQSVNIPVNEELVKMLQDNPGATIELDNDSFHLELPGYDDIPDEDDNAKRGEPLHWLTLDDQRDALILGGPEGADEPGDLVAALAHMAGLRVKFP